MHRVLILVFVFVIALLAVLPTAARSEPAGRRPRPTLPVMTRVAPPICPAGCPPVD